MQDSRINWVFFWGYMDERASTYCRLMEEVKRRVGLIRQLHVAEITTTCVEFDIELACLNLRRCLELIAFSSLVANKDVYSRLHENFSEHWRTEKILEKIRTIHSDFFPVPVRFVSGQLMPVEDDFLTESEFLVLYRIVNEVLHSWNPCRSDTKKIDLIRPVADWARLIWNLLNLHMVTFAGSDQRLIVQMHHESDGLVHVYVASPISYSDAGL